MSARRKRPSLSNLNASLQAIVSESTNRNGIYFIKNTQLNALIALGVVSQTSVDELKDLGYVDNTQNNKYCIIRPSMIWTIKK